MLIICIIIEEFHDTETNDEEAKGEIKIHVIPAEEHITLRGAQLKELEGTEGKHRRVASRNVRPFSSSLFLTAPREVSLQR